MGRHNGREALSYVPLTDLDPCLADALLDLLDDRGVAAYVAPALRRPPSLVVQPRIDRPLDRVYVDAAAVATDDDALEDLDARARALDDLDVDVDRVTGAEGRDVLADGGLVDLVETLHGGFAFFSAPQVAQGVGAA